MNYNVVSREELLKLIEGNIIIEDDCITWIGSKLGRGTSGTACHNDYGTVSIKSKNYRIHRLVYHILVTPVPKQLDVLHTCNNKSCINTDHLYLGTAKENLNDAYSDGCFTDGRRCFTKEEHLLVRKLYSSGSYSLREIGRLLKCDHHKVKRSISRYRNKEIL